MKPSYKINSDALGTKGEQRFGELCADASLICNKSDRDRAGWDFSIDFPYSPDQEASLDSRKPPLSCYVQVKTVWEESKSIKMKLGMAERLAKEPKPTFLVIFKVTKDLRFTSVYLVHIFNSRLESILKRLRVEHAKTKKPSLSKKTISFRPQPNERIEISGESLRNSIELVCGPDINQYLAKKGDQLLKLGFDERPINLSLIFEAMNEHQIVDMFLGINTNVPASNTKLSETRFGIELPGRELTDSKITISPNPTDECTFTVTGNENESPISFQGQVFTGPLIGRLKKSLIKFDIFSLILESESDDGIWTIHFNVERYSGRFTTTEWISFWEMLCTFKAGQGSIEFKFKSHPLSFELPIGAEFWIDFANNGPADLLYHVTLCKGLAFIIQRAGIKPEPKFTILEIFADAHKILGLNELIKHSKPKISLTHGEQIESLTQLPSGIFIIASKVQIVSTIFAYYATCNADFSEENIKTDSAITNFQFKKFRPIEGNSEAFDAFILGAKIFENIDNVLMI